MRTNPSQHLGLRDILDLEEAMLLILFLTATDRSLRRQNLGPADETLPEQNLRAWATFLRRISVTSPNTLALSTIMFEKISEANGSTETAQANPSYWMDTWLRQPVQCLSPY